MLIDAIKSLWGKKGIYLILHLSVLFLSLFLIVSLSIDTYKNTQFYKESSFMQIQLWICIWFIFVFFVELFMAQRKWIYIRSHFIFLVISIPYLSIINHYGWTFSTETMYLIRFIPLVRGGYALAIVVGWLTYNKASSLFVSYTTMLFATIYFSSLTFYVLEHQINPLVNDYGDALWWACMDVTTVGSNITAMTITGRVLSVLLAALGMMMFPIFTVYVTDLVQNANKKKSLYYNKGNGDGSDDENEKPQQNQKIEEAKQEADEAKKVAEEAKKEVEDTRKEVSSQQDESEKKNQNQ